MNTFYNMKKENDYRLLHPRFNYWRIFFLIGSYYQLLHDELHRRCKLFITPSGACGTGGRKNNNCPTPEELTTMETT